MLVAELLHIYSSWFKWIVHSKYKIHLFSSHPQGWETFQSYLCLFPNYSSGQGSSVFSYNGGIRGSRFNCPKKNKSLHNSRPYWPRCCKAIYYRVSSKQHLLHCYSLNSPGLNQLSAALSRSCATQVNAGRCMYVSHERGIAAQGRFSPGMSSILKWVKTGQLGIRWSWTFWIVRTFFTKLMVYRFLFLANLNRNLSIEGLVTSLKFLTDFSLKKISWHFSYSDIKDVFIFPDKSWW